MDSSRELSSSTNETSSDEIRVISSNHRRRRRFQRMTHLALSVQIFQQCPPQVARRIIVRDREGTHRQIMRDYFDENCTYPADFFHRRFRMRRELFLRILDDVKSQDAYFVRRKNYAGNLGCSSIQKMTAAIRILAYGFSSDHCDEYLKIGESIAIESLKRFCEAVIFCMKGDIFANPMNMILHDFYKRMRIEVFQGCLGP